MWGASGGKCGPRSSPQTVTACDQPQDGFQGPPTWQQRKLDPHTRSRRDQALQPGPQLTL